MRYHDPYVSELQTEEHHPPLRSIDLTEEAVKSHDAVVVVTDHTSYDWAWIVRHAQLVVDTRNATGKLVYNGGPMIQHVKLFMVFYSPNYQYKAQLVSFYQSVLQSPYIDMLHMLANFVACIQAAIKVEWMS